jgi:hypothetical protein
MSKFMKLAVGTMNLKTCSKCGETKAVSEFNKSGSKWAGGIRSYCRECQSAYHKSDSYKKAVIKYRSTKKGSKAVKKAKENYYDSEHGREKIYEYNKRARKEKREAVLAGQKARYHYRGVVNPCEVCGGPGDHKHHDDYTKPLEVRWLCRKHHAEVHK